MFSKRNYLLRFPLPLPRGLANLQANISDRISAFRPVGNRPDESRSSAKLRGLASRPRDSIWIPALPQTLV